MLDSESDALDSKLNPNAPATRQTSPCSRHTRCRIYNHNSQPEQTPAPATMNISDVGFFNPDKSDSTGLGSSPMGETTT